LNRKYSGCSATAGIKTVGLPTLYTRCRRRSRNITVLKNDFRIKVGITKEFTKGVGFAKVVCLVRRALRVYWELPGDC
jgi:hypothetical protein